MPIVCHPSFAIFRRRGIFVSRYFGNGIFILTGLFLLVVSAHCRSDALFGSNTVHVTGFQTRGLNQSGAVEWELQGQQARIKGAITEVEKFQITLHQEENRFYDLSSPKCIFYHHQNEIKSDAPLLLRSEGIIVSGIGYDIFLDHQIVLIRSTVHIILQRKSGSYQSLMPKRESKTP